MINKKLLSFDRGALRFVGANVAFQWLGMLCNVIFVRAIARLVGAAFAGMLTTGVLWQKSLIFGAFLSFVNHVNQEIKEKVKSNHRAPMDCFQSLFCRLTQFG